MVKLRRIIYGITFFFFAISASVIITLLLSPLVYNYSIDIFSLENISGLNHEELMVNYHYLIDYLVHIKELPFSMPFFPSSLNGRIHFEEVRVLIQVDLLIFVVVVLLSIMAFYSVRKHRWKYQMEKHFIFLQILPLILLFFIILAFDRVFVLFHQIFFNNDLWIFNPVNDPVINVLPQSFFMLLFIIAILIYELLLILLKIINNHLY